MSVGFLTSVHQPCAAWIAAAGKVSGESRAKEPCPGAWAAAVRLQLLRRWQSGGWCREQRGNVVTRLGLVFLL